MLARRRQRNKDFGQILVLCHLRCKIGRIFQHTANTDNMFLVDKDQCSDNNCRETFLLQLLEENTELAHVKGFRAVNQGHYTGSSSPQEIAGRLTIQLDSVVLVPDINPNCRLYEHTKAREKTIFFHHLSYPKSI